MFFWLAVIVGIGLFVVTSRTQKDGGGVHVLRRVFTYVLMFGLVMAAARALTDLIALLLGDEPFDRTGRLASALAMLTVAVPVYAGGLRVVFRWQRDEGLDERHSPGWTLYLGAVLFVSLAWAMGTATAVGLDLIRDSGVSERALAGLIVWIPVHLTHRWLTGSRGDWDKQWLESLGGSALGLGFAWVGAIMTVAWSIDRLMFSASDLIAQAGRDVPSGVVPLAIGGFVWWAYWWRKAVDLPRSAAWQLVSVFLGSVTSLASALIALGWAMFRVIEWFVGDPRPTYEAQFESFPELMAVGGVGLVVWAYHRAVLRREPLEGRVREAADYIMSGLALTAMVVAVATLFNAAMVTLFGSGSASPSTMSDRDIVLGALVALVVAVPTWRLYWWPLRQASGDQAASPIRRGYLMAVFGLGGLVAIGALIAFLFEIFQAALEGSFTSASGEGVRISLSILLAVGVSAWYHLVVWRAERPVREIAEPTMQDGRTVLLVGFTRATATALRGATGARVLETSFGTHDLIEGDVEQLTSVLERAEKSELVIVADGAGVEVVRPPT